MSQHDMNVDNGAGVAVRADLNNALKALASQSSGAAAPSPTFPAQVWADTGTGRLMQRNAANSAWVDKGPIDGAMVPQGIARYTSSGSFTVPAGVTAIYVSGCAGGAGGGACVGGSSATSGPGSGGGAGQSAIDVVIAVTPGQVIPYTIGAAGIGGQNFATPSTNGGNTTVGVGGAMLSLAGGTAGLNGSNLAGVIGGPAGGAGFPAGGDATDSVPGQASASGHGASTPFGGGGGIARSGSSSGAAGKNAFGFGASGSGGGGYYAVGAGPITVGGNGAPGLLIFKW